jgi:hypothetical protein
VPIYVCTFEIYDSVISSRAENNQEDWPDLMTISGMVNIMDINKRTIGSNEYANSICRLVVLFLFFSAYGEVPSQGGEVPTQGSKYHPRGGAVPSQGGAVPSQGAFHMEITFSHRLGRC